MVNELYRVRVPNLQKVTFSVEWQLSLIILNLEIRVAYWTVLIVFYPYHSLHLTNFFLCYLNYLLIRWLLKLLQNLFLASVASKEGFFVFVPEVTHLQHSIGLIHLLNQHHQHIDADHDSEKVSMPPRNLCYQVHILNQIFDYLMFMQKEAIRVEEVKVGAEQDAKLVCDLKAVHPAENEGLEST